MAYTINRFDGTTLTTVEDGTIDTNTDIKLVGRNYAGYGEIQNENFVFLLENFANPNPPPKPVSGQIWFDASNDKLKFYDGTQFKTTGGAEISDSAPTGLTEGDFWWDSANEQLYAYNGTDFILVGPQDAGEGITQMQSRVLIDTTGVSHSVIVSVLNDFVVHIISNEEFQIQATPENAIPGFDIVKKGITLVNTLLATGGVTSTDHIFWGTAANANQLGGKDASSYITLDDAGFTELVEFSDFGFTVGNEGDLLVEIVNDKEAVISNEVGEVIKLGAKPEGSSAAKNSLIIRPDSIRPGKDGDGNKESVTIGEADDTFAEVYADIFWGVSEQTNALLVGGSKRFGDVQATPNTVAVRDASGDLRANLFRGTALTAKYADLAEIYHTDREYPVGTVLTICQHGNHEVCVAAENDVIIGVISQNPAYLMNATAEGQPVALTGRTPVRIVGSVNKGDKIYAADNGIGSTEGNGDFFAVALESDKEQDEKLVECFIKT
jgi:hypothetical protein